MISFIDPESLFKKPVPSMDYSNSCIFGDAIKHIEQSMNCRFRKLETESHYEVDQYRTLWKRIIKLIKGEPPVFYFSFVDIHIIRNTNEICPKHNECFQLEEDDEIIFRMQMYVC